MAIDGAGLHFDATDPLGTRRERTNAYGALGQQYRSLPYGDRMSPPANNSSLGYALFIRSATSKQDSTMDKKPGILKVLHAVAGEPIDPAHDASLFTSGLLDSFALTDFVAGLEEEFHVTIPDSDLSARKFDTIDKVEAYLDAKGK
jgi:acyl carrier protein